MLKGTFSSDIAMTRRQCYETTTTVLPQYQQKRQRSVIRQGAVTWHAALPTVSSVEQGMC